MLEYKEAPSVGRDFLYSSVPVARLSIAPVGFFWNNDHNNNKKQYWNFFFSSSYRRKDLSTLFSVESFLLYLNLLLSSWAATTQKKNEEEETVIFFLRRKKKMKTRRMTRFLRNFGRRKDLLFLSQGWGSVCYSIGVAGRCSYLIRLRDNRKMRARERCCLVTFPFFCVCVSFFPFYNVFIFQSAASTMQQLSRWVRARACVCMLHCSLTCIGNESWGRYIRGGIIDTHGGAEPSFLLLLLFLFLEDDRADASLVMIYSPGVCYSLPHAILPYSRSIFGHAIEERRGRKWSISICINNEATKTTQSVWFFYFFGCSTEWSRRRRRKRDTFRLKRSAAHTQVTLTDGLFGALLLEEKWQLRKKKRAFLLFSPSFSVSI